MKHPWKVLAAGVALSTALAGCGTHHGELGNKNIRNNNIGNYRLLDKRFADDNMNEMNRVDGRQLNGNNIIGNHRNYNLKSNRQIAGTVKKLEGVRDAYVLTTNDNAYVAVGLKGESIVGSTNTRSGTEMGYAASNTGRMGSNSGRMSAKSGDGLSLERGMKRLDGSMGRMNERLGRGMDGKFDNTIDQYGRMGESRGNNGYSSLSNGYNGYGGASATNRRGHMENGLADNNNIYMARSLNEGFKTQVADAVRKSMPGIDKVFVSANPDFFSRMREYDNDAKQGHSIQPYLAEFNAMVERVFPNVDDGSAGTQKKLSGLDAHIFK
ncbi:YhcN/YlaJ family sporulation lipoprotein [Paenibacillus sp. FSL W8-1187]|uniref:YhcN/YlaJ family sporulation lipoprotein n=1 Tax=Paenibacillus sp. FSL W8-1187 TaxID=2975339 RepID=UPI0030D7D59D